MVAESKLDKQATESDATNMERTCDACGFAVPGSAFEVMYDAEKLKALQTEMFRFACGALVADGIGRGTEKRGEKTFEVISLYYAKSGFGAKVYRFLNRLMAIVKGAPSAREGPITEILEAIEESGLREKVEEGASVADIFKAIEESGLHMKVANILGCQCDQCQAERAKKKSK